MFSPSPCWPGTSPSDYIIYFWYILENGELFSPFIIPFNDDSKAHMSANGIDKNSTKTRLSITPTDRRNIRAKKAAEPSLTQAQLCNWFNDTYQRKLTQGQVSRCLSKSYDYLDHAEPADLDKVRLRKSKWPLLEKIVEKYQVELTKKQFSVTNDGLRQVASMTWPLLYEETCPSFSSGWIDKIKKKNANYQAGSNNDTLKTLQEKIASYRPEDVYCVDETGLFWRYMPASRHDDPELECKKLSFLMCYNASGTDKLPILVVGNDKPLLYDISQPVQSEWRWNPNGLISPKDFKCFLNFFENLHRWDNRKVLLLMDNFIMHEKALSEMNLEYTTVEFLPTDPKCTNVPHHNGAIQAVKLGYRTEWASYITKKLEENACPSKTLKFRTSVEWLSHA